MRQLAKFRVHSRSIAIKNRALVSFSALSRLFALIRPTPSAFYHSSRKLTAALSLVAYEFFRIPNVFGSGSSFHLGNTFTALTAMLLDGVSGGLAGAIGLALADILAGDPGYAITTFILKFIIGLVCGFVAHKVIHLKDYPTANRGKYLLVVTASAFSGLLVNVFTDPFIGYFRNRFIFGQPAEIASVFTKIASGVTLINSLLSTVCAVILYLALRPALEKAHLLPKD